MEEKKRSAVRSTLKYYWRATKPFAWSFFGGLGLSTVIELIFSVFEPLILANLIQKVVDGVPFSDIRGDIILYAALLFGGQVVLMRLVIYLIWRRQIKSQELLHQMCFRDLVNRSMNFHNNKFSGSLLTQEKRFVASIENFDDCINQQILPFIVAFIAPIVVLWPVAPVFVLVLIGGVLTFIVAASLMFKSSRTTKRAVNESESKMIGNLADDLSNLLTIKSYAREAYELSSFSGAVHRWFDNFMKHIWNFITRSAILNTVNVTLSVGIFIVLAGAHEWWGVGIGMVVLMLNMSLRLIDKMWNWHNILKTINTAFADAEEMTEILDEPNELADSRNRRLVVERGAVEFKEITFKHDGAFEPIFERFGLKIPAGQRVGLVGISGSGKTTLTKLLLRFADVEAGEILVDEQDVKSVTQNSLREQIAYVPQETTLFHRSIAENIAYAKPDATAAEIERAAKLAHADEFIKTLPQGYETLVGERGVKLSGGQRQRVAIARAILKDAPILLLDEATSALDSESEGAIQAAFTNLMKGRTALVVAHRLSTVMNLDRIIVLENGRIAEDGTHAELLKNNCAYARLWQRQSGAFVGEEE
jgi:ATP-binding cassette subfamily B protein